MRMQNEQKNLIKIYTNLLDEHRVWLKGFDKRYSTKWENLLNKNCCEAAICEAATRKLLSEQEVSVKPNENLATGGPDFLCTKDGKNFYVEVTCITKDAMTKATRLPSEPEGSVFCCSSSPTKRILQEIGRKAERCANLNSPCIVVVCTLHQWGGGIITNDIEIQKLLTGELLIGGTLNPNSGRFENFKWISRLWGALFNRFAETEKEKVVEARKTISAVLIFAISAKNYGSAKGLLHPNPNRSFDRKLLPKIEFCKLADGYQTGSSRVKWV